jgi:hypothetical protein
MGRPFGFHGWDLPIALAMIAAAAATVTLLVLGGFLIAEGERNIAEANAWVDQQNARGCGGWNGTGPFPACAPLAPGMDQTQGIAGQQQIDLGTGLSLEALIPLGAIGALGLLQFGRWVRVAA